MGNAKHSQNSLQTKIPKLTDTSQNLYIGSTSTNINKTLRYLESPIIMGLLFTSNIPLTLFKLSLFYIFGGNALIYSVSRRLASRVDYLPNLEMICVTKNGAFGGNYSSFWGLGDLEKVEFKRQTWIEENFFWKIHERRIDREMVFRNRKTGELLMFEHEGVWDWEGISHPHLNDKEFFNK